MSSFKDTGGYKAEVAINRPSLIERAFQLARSGEYRNKTLIIEALKREGYEAPVEMLHGLAMARQLREAIAQAQSRLARKNLKTTVPRPPSRS